MKRRTRRRVSSDQADSSLIVRQRQPLKTSQATPANQFHQQLGNRAVGQFLQAKLNISQPQDAHEQEADHIAYRVMRMPSSSASPAGSAQINGPSGPGQSLSLADRAFFEPRFGHDFSNVRLHTDWQAAAAAASIDARAFTINRDIVFGAGEFAPGSESGRRLLSHELTHVVQQDGAPATSDTIWRQPAGGAAAGGAVPPVGPAPHALANPLFAGDAELQSVLDGKKVISSGKGKHIFKVQTGLMNLGYALPIFGADSDFGKETTLALGQFQNDNTIPVTEVLDAATMDALDQKAPAAALDKYPDYAQLLGDGLLDFTVGVGYDEDGSFDIEIEPKPGKPDTKHAIVPELKNLGFTEKAAADAEKVYAKAGMKMPGVGGGRYFIWPAALKYGGKDVDVIVRLLTYKDPDVRNAFLEAMQNSDVAIYTGHGRYGSGPDFDPKTKGAGNILINPDPTVPDPGTPHMYHLLKKQGVTPALPGVAFDQKYKIWFFDGCNTKYYMPAIRRLAKIDTKKTDVFGWGTEIAIDTTGEDVVSFVNGLIKQQSAKDLIENLNKINKIKKPSKGVGGEGLGDNP